MDTFSHAMWGAVLFSKKDDPRSIVTGAAIGMSPDLAAFGSWRVARLVGLSETVHWEAGPPPLSMIPDYVFSLYNCSHSLLFWSLVIFLVYRFMSSFPLILLAAPLAVLMDIPTHTLDYFPTPYLWPLETPLVNGFKWSHPVFLVLNVCLLGFALYLRRRTLWIPLFQEEKGQTGVDHDTVRTSP